MNKAPKVGSRARYPGGLVVGPCVGVVTKIYPKHEWDDDKSDYWNAVNGKPLPESEWSVSFKPDVLPEKWCYVGCDKFAPSVSDLEPE
jgi:hypothetical protein